MQIHQVPNFLHLGSFAYRSAILLCILVENNNIVVREY